jgi:hypothetical protein
MLYPLSYEGFPQVTGPLRARSLGVIVNRFATKLE